MYFSYKRSSKTGSRKFTMVIRSRDLQCFCSIILRTQPLSSRSLMTQDDCWSFSHCVFSHSTFQAEREGRGKSHTTLPVSKLKHFIRTSAQPLLFRTNWPPVAIRKLSPLVRPIFTWYRIWVLLCRTKRSTNIGESISIPCFSLYREVSWLLGPSELIGDVSQYMPLLSPPATAAWKNHWPCPEHTSQIQFLSGPLAARKTPPTRGGWWKAVILSCLWAWIFPFPLHWVAEVALKLGNLSSPWKGE